MGHAIDVAGLGKRYFLSHRGSPAYETFRDSLTRAARRVLRPWARSGAAARREEFWALRDISFRVTAGERVGIIGLNGAGKSTLLKLLSRITVPSAGRFSLRGRVASLLEVGTGFHPELTGRENVYLNGAILGMGKAEIRRKFDAIVDFSEVERFLDTPVKHYSSGMYVRLAFAVAAHLEPEIMVVDEVLAVGDASFQNKCLGKMEDIGKEGRTVLFVSHNMGAIARLCQRALLLDRGGLAAEGAVDDIINRYLGQGVAGKARREWADPSGAPGDGVVRLRSVSAAAGDGNESGVFGLADDIHLALAFDVLSPDRVLSPSLRLTNQEGVIVLQSNDWSTSPRGAGRHEAGITLPGHLLNEGTYYVLAAISEMPNEKRVYESDVVSFQVVDHGGASSARRVWAGSLPGVVRPDLAWKTTGPR